MIAHLLALPLVALVQLAPGPASPPLTEAPAGPVFVPPPAPSPPLRPDSPYYDQQRANEERRLREECYSEAGIELIMEHRERARAIPPEVTASANAAEREVAEAAHAEPLDVERLERAIRARSLLRAEQDAQREGERVALLSKLSAPDRTIYARGFAIWRPWPPQVMRTCPS